MKDQRLCLDIINTLPQNIIETILCLLPIEETVRTSILSKEWRYKWTKIPKLEFDEDTFKEFSDKSQVSVLEQTFSDPSQRRLMTNRCKLFYAIYQVLLVHQGPILEFSLFMEADDTCVEIDQIINYLARNNTLMKLTLNIACSCSYNLPLSVFSLHQLTDLYLCNCTLPQKPIISGFGNLTTLYILDVYMDNETLLNLLSSSPLLKSFTMLLYFDTIVSYKVFTLIELFECLPVIEHLTISNWVFERFFEDEDVVPQTHLVHLKYFYVEPLCFSYIQWLPSLVSLIRCFPNLEKIKLWMTRERREICGKSPISAEDYSYVWLEHLKELVIISFTNLKPKLEFVRLILAKSPVLKKVRIILDTSVSNNEELEILRFLLCCPRESRMVQIIVRR